MMDPNETEVMADQGNWTVGDCILVRVASQVCSDVFLRSISKLITSIPNAQIVLQPDPDNVNTTVTMELPVGAKATGTCK